MPTLQDTPAELRAAEAALRINPGWIRAVLRVAEAHQNGSAPALARSCLEHGLSFHPRSSDIMCALARGSWREGDVQAALRQARSAVEFEPADHESWQLYARFAETLKDSEQVTALARELSRQRPWNARIWLRLAELLAEQSENLASIAALSEALERAPDAPDVIALYAQALTRIGKKAEALAACERPVTGYYQRGALAARRAWVLWEFGDHDAACLEMRKVLAGHPDQLWGHRELVTWELEREQFPAAVRLARELTKLNPLNAVSYGYLGVAERKDNSPDAAWRAFTEAARLDPSYEYAGHQRIELALLDRRFERAESVIAEQGGHVSLQTVCRWRIIVACARNQVPYAVAALGEMARHPATPDRAFAALASQLQKLEPVALRRELGVLVRDPGVHRELGHLWVYALHAQGNLPSSYAISRLRSKNAETFATAARAYFELLGENAPSWYRVAYALVWLGPGAYRSDEVWGKVGYALIAARAYVAAQCWLSNYPHRSAVEAWMLQNYRVAALENYQPEAARRAVEHALTLPADGTLHLLLAFAAFGRAASGDMSGAREILSGRSAQGLSGRNEWLFESARLLMELSDSGEDRSDNLSLLRARILGSRNKFGLFSSGTLLRWLARGVLRQTFDLKLFLYRWSLLLALGAFCAVLAYQGADAITWTLAVCITLAVYLVRRLAI